jgi:hypothetical protein
MRPIVGALSAIVILAAAPAAALDLSALSNQEASAGMKDALAQGAGKAVSLLGAPGGFLDNQKVKIPLPENLRRVESGLRLLGMRQQADELVVAMNRAAEAAVPEAKALLIEAVRNMSVQDAKKILTGGETSATDYFRRATSKQLTERFLPIVTVWTQKVGLATQYSAIRRDPVGAATGAARKVFELLR